MKKRLYKSTTDKMLFGVCGGVAEYFEIDPTIVRVIAVISTIFSAGFPLLVYIAMAISMPVRPDSVSDNAGERGSSAGQEFKNDDSDSPEISPKKTDMTLILGISLVALGTLFLIQRLIPSFEIPFEILAPLILIGIGVMMLVRHKG